MNHFVTFIKGLRWFVCKEEKMEQGRNRWWWFEQNVYFRKFIPILSRPDHVIVVTRKSATRVSSAQF